MKLLTSGPEERIDEPEFSGGKFRNERRVHWWEGYYDTYCVFGHYGPDEGKPRMGRSAFCIDYGVGKRWTERQDGKPLGSTWKLAALRLPEREVVFDDGSRDPQATLLH